MVSIDKMHCNEFQKSLSQQLFFEFYFFMFYFFPALQCLDRYYNENPVKQTASLYMKLPLKPVFFSMFRH